MRSRLLPGELILCTIFAGTGVFWIVHALKLPLWDGFAPSSGFLPLVYGGLLVVLAVAATASDAVAAPDDAAEKTPPQRALMILLALTAGVAGIEIAGFFASMFLLMLFLFAVAERAPILPSLAVAATSSLVLTVVFRKWLGVPLPAGPWGF